MKTQFTYPALIFTAFLFSGCVKELDYTSDKEEGDVIEISSVFTDVHTKAIKEGTSFTLEEAQAGIGLFLLNEEDDKSYGYNPMNIKYSYNGTKWTAATPLRAGSKEGILCGYYPWRADIKDATKIPVASSLNGLDFLYAPGKPVSSAGETKNVDLVMKHALARVSFSVRLDQNYQGDGKLTGVVLSGDGVAASGTLNAKTGVISSVNNRFSTDGLDLTLNKTDLVTLDFLVVPVTGDDSTTPDLTVGAYIDGKFLGTTFSGDDAVAIRQGQWTSFTLVATNSKLSIESAAISGWQEGGQRTLEIGDHTLTVTFSEDAGISDDVLLDVKSDDVSGTVTIKAVSMTNHRRLKCTKTGSAKETLEMIDGPYQIKDSELDPEHDGKYTVYTQSKDREYYTYVYTISEITSDITVNIAYSTKLNFIVDSNFREMLGDFDLSKKYGELEKSLIDVYEGDVINLNAPPIDFVDFDGWFDEDGNLISNERTLTLRPFEDMHVSAVFNVDRHFTGVFTIDTLDRKRVRFAKGNLWAEYTGREENRYDYHIEEKQYIAPQFTSPYNSNHITHFTWSKSKNTTAEQFRAINYFDSWNPGDPNDVFEFWAAPSRHDSTRFEIGPFRNTLACPTKNEFRYLLQYHTWKTGVTVCGSPNCLIVLPDDWEWSVLTGTEILDEYSETTAVKWSDMDAAGALCLPAAGRRASNKRYVNFMGVNPDTMVDVGIKGYYWTSSRTKGLPDELMVDPALVFAEDYLKIHIHEYPLWAHSVRLYLEQKKQ